MPGQLQVNYLDGQVLVALEILPPQSLHFRGKNALGAGKLFR
jgi:hypothetical protein